jgi:hypothetical protein
VLGGAAGRSPCRTERLRHWPAVVVLGITTIPIIDFVVNRRFAKKEQM